MRGPRTLPWGYHTRDKAGIGQAGTRGRIEYGESEKLNTVVVVAVVVVVVVFIFNTV